MGGGSCVTVSCCWCDGMDMGVHPDHLALLLGAPARADAVAAACRCIPMCPSLTFCCAEDGNINLWEIKTAPGGPNGDSSSGSSCAVHSDPLAVLRLDNPQQQLQPQPHEDTGVLGQQPGVAAAAAEKVAAAGRGGPALALAAAPGLGPDLLSGVAEDADAPQSRYEHRAHEVHCVAAGQGLPPGCLLSGTGGWAGCWVCFTCGVQPLLRCWCGCGRAGPWYSRGLVSTWPTKYRLVQSAAV